MPTPSPDRLAEYGRKGVELLLRTVGQAPEQRGARSLAAEHGIPKGKSAVTVFAGFGLQGIVDQKSREPESLANSFAECLKAMQHPKLYAGADALVVVAPEHERTFREAGWSKARLYDELYTRTQRPADEIMPGVDDMAEGTSAFASGTMARKFREGGVGDQNIAIFRAIAEGI